MVFDEQSHPVAIYWKNGVGIKYFTLKEFNETDMDLLWEVDSPQEK